jgi:hypothetical protein
VARTFIKLLPSSFLRLSEGLISVELTPFPDVSIAAIDASITEGVSAELLIALTHVATADITVDYTTGPGTGLAGVDYLPTAGTVTIAAGQSSAVVTVPTFIRTGTQGSRQFTVTISNAQTVPGDVLDITDAVETITVNDAFEVPVAPTLRVDALAAVDEGQTLTFRITASDTPQEDITFTYATSNGSALAGVDYTAASGTGTLMQGVATADITVSTTLRSGFQGARTFVMTISGASAPIAGVVAITKPTATGTIAETELPVGDNAYFDALKVRPDCIKFWSLRDNGDGPNVADLISNATSPTQNTAYMYATDTDPKKQDAAKSWIPAFSTSQKLTVAAQGVDATSLRIPVTSVSNTQVVQHSVEFKFDSIDTDVASEIIRLGPSGAFKDTVTNEIILQAPRAKYGTTSSAHAGGTPLYSANTSLYNQIVMPVNKPAGHTYDVIFDTYLTKSWMRTGLGAYKMWRMQAVPSGLYMEAQVRFGGNPGGGVPIPAEYDANLHVGVATLRCYGSPQETSTHNNPCLPMTSQFIVWPERWTRWWMRIELGVAPAFCYASLWCADEVQEPVQLLDRQAFGTRTSLDDWRVMLNTSTNFLTGGRTTAYPELGLEAFRDLVQYTKNHVILEDVSLEDLEALLVKP